MDDITPMVRDILGSERFPIRLAGHLIPPSYVAYSIDDYLNECRKIDKGIGLAASLYGFNFPPFVSIILLGSICFLSYEDDVAAFKDATGELNVVPITTPLFAWIGLTYHPDFDVYSGISHLSRGDPVQALLTYNIKKGETRLLLADTYKILGPEQRNDPAAQNRLSYAH